MGGCCPDYNRRNFYRRKRRLYLRLRRCTSSGEADSPRGKRFLQKETKPRKRLYSDGTNSNFCKSFFDASTRREQIKGWTKAKISHFRFWPRIHPLFSSLSSVKNSRNPIFLQKETKQRKRLIPTEQIQTPFSWRPSAENLFFTKGNQYNEGLLQPGKNRVFVFFVIFCKKF